MARPALRELPQVVGAGRHVNAREQQIARVLAAQRATESLVAMIEGGLETPRERQVKRLLADLEIVQTFGLPGLPGGPPLNGGMFDFVRTNETKAATAINLLMDEAEVDVDETFALDRLSFIKSRSGVDAGATFTFDGQSFEATDVEWKWTPSAGAEIKVGVDPAVRHDQMLAYSSRLGYRGPFTVLTGLAT